MKRVLILLAILSTFAAMPARATTHALIMTISKYRNGIPPLAGVRHDAATATAIAKRMGVLDGDIRVYRDEQLTLAGMRAAFAELEQRVLADDQVFIYYSGHGGRQLVRDPQPRCGEALITVHGDPYPDSEVEAVLRRLATRASKLVVFVDACHSGGLSTRSVGAEASDFAPKYFARAGAGDECSTPVNVLTRSLGQRTRSAGSGMNNYVYIAAARANEVSLDSPTIGGLASTSWRECIEGAAADRDGSGGLSAEEIQACAQQRINAKLRNVRGFLPHNVTILGNAKAVLAFQERAPAAAVPVAAPAPVPAAPPAAVAQPAPPPAPAPVAQPAPTPPATPQALAQPAAYYTLLDIYNSRDDRRVVSLTSGKPAFRIGTDDVDFTVTSSHEGYLYLLMVGTDGRTFDMLFPNQIDGANRIAANTPLRLPRPSWQVKAGGPAGKNHLLALVTESPRDFTKVGMQPAGPFSVVNASATSAKDIQLVSGSSANASSGDCAASGQKLRSLQVQRRCSNAYGAAMMILEEVN